MVVPELRLLRSFVAVCEAGSMTRAARGLVIAQQSLSQQMRALEAQVGAPLLRRSSRGVVPTAVGTALRDEATVLLAAADRAMEAVARSVEGQHGTVRVGFLSSSANELIPPVVRWFADHRPGVQLQTADLPVAELVAGVRDGRLDAAVSRPPLVDDLHATTVGREAVMAALPEGHPLAGARTLRLADLADEPWVLTPRSAWPPWHDHYDADFAAAGFVPRVVRRGTTAQGSLALVAAGVGVTRVAASSRSLRSGGVAFVPLEGETTSTVVLTHPRARAPWRDALCDAVRAAMGDDGVAATPR